VECAKKSIVGPSGDCPSRLNDALSCDESLARECASADAADHRHAVGLAWLTSEAPPSARCYAQPVTPRSTLVVLTLAALSACDAQPAHQEPASPMDGAIVPDADAPDATLDDAPTSEAGSGNVCPLATAATCGIGLAPCAGCCVESQCIAEGDSCGEGLHVCHNASCGDRGGLGQLCATGKAAESLNYGRDGSVTCGYSPWTGCTDTRSVCADGGCVPCGLAGEPCCDLGCGPDTYCEANGQCSAACGAAGQPCCGGGTLEYTCDGACLRQGGTFMCVAGSSCHADAGSCTTCGSQGQPCCEADTCNANGGASCFGDAGCLQIHNK